MNKLFKLIIFSLLLSIQLFPQSISRLKAKKEREKRKREKLKIERVVEEDSESDSLAVSKLIQENAENTEVANVNDTATDSFISKVSLSINTIPEKVDVFLDGSLIGKTPISEQKILSGDHIFEIRKDGFAPISYELNVNPSKSVNLDFFMNPVYNVKFKTDEVGLIFELNDDHRWKEDAIRMQLEAGDHQLRVYKLGEIIDEQIIVADQPLTFQYYLKRGVVIKP